MGILFLTACQKPVGKKEEIGKIEIATTGCLRGCPIVGLQIDSSFKLVYYGGYKSKLQGYYEGKITQDIWDTLNFKLKHINYRKIDTSEYLEIDGENAEAIFYWNKQKRHIYRSIYENPDSISDALIWIINCCKRVKLQKSKDSIKFETTYQNIKPPIMAKYPIQFPPPKFPPPKRKKYY
jgi:hypothetical protein